LSVYVLCVETIFSFLIGYINGLEAYFQRSVERGKDQNPRESMPAWMSSHQLAKEALELSISAALEAANGGIVSANETAELALAKLEERSFLLHSQSWDDKLTLYFLFSSNSVNAVPESHKRHEWDLMAAWDVEYVDRG
jgi:hypothetical protein